MATFPYDVFLSHSSRDKEIVRSVAERLRADGVKVWFDDWILKSGDNIPSKIEEGLEHSRVLVFCMSAHAFGSDWAELESRTFRFRDPLNKERRFVPLRLDDAPINNSLAQFLYINWLPATREQEYPKLLEGCRPPKPSVVGSGETIELTSNSDKDVQLLEAEVTAFYAFNSDATRVLTSGSKDNSIRLWEMKNGRCVRTLSGHSGTVFGILWSSDERLALSGSDDATVRLWDVEEGRCLRVFKGHSSYVWNLAWSTDRALVLSAAWDKTLRLWNTNTGQCLRVFEGHSRDVNCVIWSADQHWAVSGAADNTLRLWDVDTGQCLRVFEGHTDHVWSLSWSPDEKWVLSGSSDKTMRLWDVATGHCLRVLDANSSVASLAWRGDQRQILSGSTDGTAQLWEVETGSCLRVLRSTSEVRFVGWSADRSSCFSGDLHGNIRTWDLSSLVAEERESSVTSPTALVPLDQVQYTNAKVLLVGDTNAGKTGLTHRLALGEWKPSEDSTVGAWSTQLSLKPANAEPGVDREIWLWDFGGQADQRLIHQLYMDRTALILLLFNADQEDVLPGLRDWQSALRRCVKKEIPYFLVAGRIDTGFKASRVKLQAFAKEQGLTYYETSAKSGEGCDDLRVAMIASLPWAQMEKRTSPRIFKLIKDEILKLRDEGQVLHTFKELRELLWQRLRDEPRFSDATLQTVIGLLDGPGVVKELDYGTYILLAPEWINAYAQAVIRTLRSAENDLGVLPLRSIAEGKLIYQSIGREGVPVAMKRLPTIEERVVLGEMERQLEQRGLCLRQGDKLVFPSHCGRERPAVLEHPSVFVSYTVKGFLDDIYATLVVKLADSESFQLKELWRDAADFVTLVGDHHMGVKLTRQSGSDGDISVYFGKGVTQEEQVIFANYIHEHLKDSCEESKRLRQYVCPKCDTSKGNPHVLMEKLLKQRDKADTECDKCGERFPLWDALEKKFASDAVRKQVEQRQADDLAQLTTRRKGKLLVLDVGARITSANQKWIEIPGDEDDGIDMMVEFTDEAGNGIGKGLCLQLKAGNSFLKKRKGDGAEIFAIKKPRWVKTWINQPFPVMLVIGTFPEDDERVAGSSRLEFAEVRWMEISSVLKRESKGGTKPVTQIEFKGEPLDLSSVMRWRQKCLHS